ncbi:hypothetical protein FRC14_000013 [Serendipita sp. 396]|nr:hypothetical protein FRC14_000013 [Serendipita sp. 396]KAG8789908.1 hypothetical protein FRC15_000100 [Serendipita sp. 397]KAG8804758.1 hypothetical protein FRC16_000012 [Serendipita sp. 398]KAG8825918.1 hypothetical protein FRC19_010177 [Serendipita sp. 401]KAG8836606.1 hypothetical protein FRC18_011050 [Serendipita sp. 400]KAG8852666.1 hypothetical protein FRB91_006143 [Serendipita sp. 411]KAG8872953.1 hypothetical protein FRC20_008832 [Serendipita sp. 405]KAG9055813.1 hypothetical prot
MSTRDHSRSPVSQRSQHGDQRDEEVGASTPKLGGIPAFILFCVILVAFVVQSAATQHVQTTLGFRHPFLLFYIAHSSFSIIFPIHLLYLHGTSRKPISYYLSLIKATLQYRFSSSQLGGDPSTFPTQRIALITVLLTIGISLPGLLWYISVSMSSISDVTAIWNSNAFWAYILTVYILMGSNAPDGKWWTRFEAKKIIAVLMACIGVTIVVYSGVDSQRSGEDDDGSTKPTAPLAGDLLTLVASILYALVQVMYKKYIALPNEPSEGITLATGRVVSQSGEESPLIDEQQVDHPLNLEAIAGGEGPLSYQQLIDSLPFGLYPNFMTSLAGLTTLLCLWPLPILLATPESPNGDPNHASPVSIAVSIAAIALAGLVWNSGYLVLLSIWGPVLSSVGNLLTIVLMLLVETLFMNSPFPSFFSVIGCGMIAAGFGVLVSELVRGEK